MRKRRFTDEQMVAILREADQTSVAEAAKAHGVSTKSIYAWRKRFGTMTPDETRRLKALEKEMPGSRGSSQSAPSRSTS